MTELYAWPFVAISDYEVHFGHLPVTKNDRYTRVVLRRFSPESSFFRFSEIDRINVVNDRSTNDRFGESYSRRAASGRAAKFQSRLLPALFPSYLMFHSFFLPPNAYPATSTPIAFGRVREFCKINPPPSLDTFLSLRKIVKPLTRQSKIDRKNQWRLFSI